MTTEKNALDRVKATHDKNAAKLNHIKRLSVIILVVIMFFVSNIATYHFTKAKWYSAGAWQGVYKTVAFIETYGIESVQYLRAKGLTNYQIISSLDKE